MSQVFAYKEDTWAHTQDRKWGPEGPVSQGFGPHFLGNRLTVLEVTGSFRPITELTDIIILMRSVKENSPQS